MNQIREIVTKAVIAKGKKKINLKEIVKPDSQVYSVLGCWIINHEFEANMDEESATVNGTFEINVWYSSLNNSKTEIARKIVKYSENIKTRKVVNDAIDNDTDVIARIMKHPTCINAIIVENDIEIEISLEILIEIIGETKMQVTVFEPNDDDIEEEDFENIINEDFLRT